jgi:hypothetical protein
MRIYLGKFKEPNLPTEIELAQRFGPISRVTFHATFVHFDAQNITTQEEFSKIHSRLNGSTWKGSKISVQLAKTPSPHSPEFVQGETPKVDSSSLYPKVKKRRSLVRQIPKLGRGWVRGKLAHMIISPLKLRTPHFDAKGGRIRVVNTFNNLKTSLTVGFSDTNEEKSINQIWKKYTIKLIPSTLPVDIPIKEPIPVEKSEIPTPKKANIIAGSWTQVFVANQPISFSIAPSTVCQSSSKTALSPVPKTTPRRRPPSLLGLVKTKSAVNNKSC